MVLLHASRLKRTPGAPIVEDRQRSPQRIEKSLGTVLIEQKTGPDALAAPGARPPSTPPRGSQPGVVVGDRVG
jgi:hypothetical protein